VNAVNSCCSNVQIVSTVAQEIDDIIEFLMPNNTCGCDEIATDLIKMKSVNVCMSLNQVCNTYLL
jgi:hypothetical protein